MGDAVSERSLEVKANQNIFHSTLITLERVQVGANTVHSQEVLGFGHVEVDAIDAVKEAKGHNGTRPTKGINQTTRSRDDTTTDGMEDSKRLLESVAHGLRAL